MPSKTRRNPKRKRKKTASMIVAEKQHNAWLKSMGLDKKPKRVNRTMISVNYHTELPIEEKKTFIQLDWSPCVKKPERKTEKTYTVAIAYNKEPTKSSHQKTSKISVEVDKPFGGVYNIIFNKNERW